jgi:hypothetical protein
LPSPEPVKEVVEREWWRMGGPSLPKPLEQDPGLQPGSHGTQGFGPGDLRTDGDAVLLFFPLVSFLERGLSALIGWWRLAKSQRLAVLRKPGEPGDTSRKRRRSRPTASAAGSLDRF